MASHGRVILLSLWPSRGESCIALSAAASLIMATKTPLPLLNTTSVTQMNLARHDHMLNQAAERHGRNEARRNNGRSETQSTCDVAAATFASDGLNVD